MRALLQAKKLRSQVRIGAALATALPALALGANPSVAGAGGSTRARTPSGPCAGEGLRPNRANAARADAATLCLINVIRRANHLGSLRANPQLQAVATAQVKDMVRLDYFADIRPSGITPATLVAATPYGRHARSLAVGENIGWGTGRASTPARMVQGWMESPPHRELLLTAEYRDAGVGTLGAAPPRLAEGEAGATYALELARR